MQILFFFIFSLIIYITKCDTPSSIIDITGTELEIKEDQKTSADTQIIVNGINGICKIDKSIDFNLNHKNTFGFNLYESTLISNKLTFNIAGTQSMGIYATNSNITLNNNYFELTGTEEYCGTIEYCNFNATNVKVYVKDTMNYFFAGARSTIHLNNINYSTKKNIITIFYSGEESTVYLNDSSIKGYFFYAFAIDSVKLYITKTEIEHNSAYHLILLTGSENYIYLDEVDFDSSSNKFISFKTDENAVLNLTIRGTKLKNVYINCEDAENVIFNLNITYSSTVKFIFENAKETSFNKINVALGSSSSFKYEGYSYTSKININEFKDKSKGSSAGIVILIIILIIAALGVGLFFYARKNGGFSALKSRILG